MALLSHQSKIVASQGRRPRKDGYLKAHRGIFNPGPHFSPTYTPKQEAIIRGEDVANLRKNDITNLIKKAEYLGDYDLAEKLYGMYGYKFHQREVGDPSYAEALEILDDLTPDDLK